MNRIFVTVLAVWMSFMALHAANVVSVGGASGDIGSRVEINVSLKNDSPDISAAEIRIPIPEGVVPVAGSLVKNESRLPNHSVTADINDGKYVIVIYNTSLSNIPTGNGEICKFSLELGDNPGNFNLTPIVKLSNKDGSVISSDTEGGHLTVLGPRLEIREQFLDFGRVPIKSTVIREIPVINTGTTTLDISGFSSTVEGLSASFSSDNINAGESGVMTLNYSPTLRSKDTEGRITVNSNSVGRAPFIVVHSVPFSVNELHIDNAEGICDDEVTVGVNVNNMEPIVGAEFSLRLPDELEYVEGSAAKSARSGAMNIDANFDSGRNLRIILYNASNKTLDGDDGEILTFRLKLTGNTGSYVLSPEKVILSNKDGENMVSANYGGSVSITSPQMYSDSEFNIGNVPLSGDNTFYYPVSNYGSAPLKIEKVSFLKEGFVCNAKFPITIQPGEQGAIPVTVSNPSFGEFRTIMNIYSNDPSNRMKSVEVSGNYYSSNELSFKGAFVDNKFILMTALTNEAEIVALQMDLVVPDGMTTDEAFVTLAERAKSHSFTLANVEKSRYRLILFSLNNIPFTGNTGDILSLAFEGTGSEGKDIRIENIKLSNADGIDFTAPDSKVIVESIPVPVKSLTLSETSISLKVNQTNRLLAVVLPDNATDKTVTWTSSNENIATVDADGNVTAKSLGMAVITAQSGDVKATCEVTVVATPVESISLDTSALQLKVSESHKLTATVLPADATDKTVTWSSSNENIATVDADGNVTAKSLGTAVFTAQSGDVKATCEVTVVATPVESISLDTPALQLKVSESHKLTATVLPADATDKTVTWTSSNENIVSVDADGNVTAKSLGTAVITAQSGDVKATCEVTVVATPVESISLDKSALQLKVSESHKLTATVQPADATDKTVTWTSSNDNIVSVDADGNVTAKSLGTAVITAQSGDVKATCEVTVVATPVESISLDKSALQLKVSESHKLTATVLPADATDKTVTWTSSNENIVSVDADGNVTAKSLGTTVITAQSGDVKATCEVTVVATPVESISLDSLSLQLKVSESHKLTATVLPVDATDKSVTWTSSNDNIVSVDADGNVTAKSLGTAVITAQSGGVKATCEVTVVATPVESISLDKSALQLKASESYKLTATVLPSDATYKSVTWTSSNENVATVDADGNVTAKSLGTAVITAQSGGVKATCEVTVVATPVESISLDKSALQLKVSESHKLTATVLPTDATDKTVTWTSSNENIATVDADGNVTAKLLGTAVITAQSGGVKATCEVTVVATPVESISLDKSALQLKVSESHKLTATVLPADATDKTVTWTSSNDNIVSVDADGNVTAKSLGTAVITAQSGGVKATCEVTVVATPVESISLDKSALQLKVSESHKLTATVGPENATDKSVTWTSSNENIVSVDADGNVTAKSLGTAVITAQSGGVKATCEVMVVATPVESISLDNSSLQLKVSESHKLTATVLPADATDKTVTWTSSNDNIVSVDADGNVTAKSLGTAVITAQSGGVKATCEVMVVATPVESISLDVESMELRVSESQKLTATILPFDATDKTVVWSSSDNKVAIVDAEGIVTAKSIGKVVITAQCGEVKATCNVEVFPPLAASITLDQQEITALVGDKIQLTATVLPEDASNQNLEWKSSDERIATVSNNGMVTVVDEGEAIITVSTTDGSLLSASCKINGTSGIDSIFVDGRENVMIYTLTGVLIKREANIEDFNNLAPGFYIVNRQKVYKR